MKKRNRFRNILLISFAVIFAAAAGIGEAWAYFTTYASAQGGYIIHLGYETEIEENFLNGVKTVIISNSEDSQPVYIRAKAFGGGNHPLTYSGGSWYDGGDGYWYYDKIVYGGEQTEPLDVTIANIPDIPEEEFEFDVVVIYESTPVRYDTEGKPYADWTNKWDTGESEGGN